MAVLYAEVVFSSQTLSLLSDPLSPSRKVREGLADVISIHSSQSATLTAPVLILHTEAKVLL